MVQIVLKSELWKHCKCLVQAVDRTSAYANSSKFLSIVQNFITRCLRKHSHAVVDTIDYKEAIEIAAAEIVQSSYVEMTVGDTGRYCDLALGCPSGGTILVNGGWMVQLQSIYERNEADASQYEAHMCLLIVKLLSALCQSFTDRVLKAGHSIRSKAAASNPSIRTDYVDHSAAKLDLGTWAEKLLSGCGVRFHFARNLTLGPALDFGDILLFQLDPEGRMGMVKRKAVDMLSFIKRVSTSDTLDLDDFHLELRPYKPSGPPCQCTWTQPWCERHPRSMSGSDDHDSGDDNDDDGIDDGASSDGEYDGWEIGPDPTEALRAPCGGLTEASYLARTVAHRLPHMKF